MSQSIDDDLNFDEDFFSDGFAASVETNKELNNKRNFDEHSNSDNQPMKKKCTQLLDARTQNILSIIKPKMSENKSTQSTTNVTRVKIFNFQKPETPERNRRVVQRRFPGPAGILPQQVNMNITALEEINVTIHKKLESDDILCSQTTEDNFRKGPWNRMLEDWSNNNYKISLPQKYTISWTKNKAMSNKLIGQNAPFLAAVIESVDTSNKNTMIVLKDKSDEIKATLSTELWDDYYEFLQSGSVIVLKQVGVVSTSKNCILSITSINLITIYSDIETDEMAQTIKLQKLTLSDVIKTIEEVKRKNAALIQAKRLQIQQSVVSNNPYFKTNKIDQQNSLKQNINIAMQNKTLQLISNLRTANKIVCETNEGTRSVNNIVGKAANSSTPNKFNFAAKSGELNKENTQQNSATISSTESDTDILSQVLDGVNTDSLFEDF